MTKKITPDEHSDIVGGSTAGRVLACPGSVQLNQAVKSAHITRIAKTLAQEERWAVVNPDLVDEHNLHACPQPFIEAVHELYRAETTSEYAAEGTALHEAMAWILDNDEEPESVVDRKFEGITITAELFTDCVEPALAGFDDYCDRVYEEDGEDLVFTIEERCQVPGIPGAFGTSDIVGKTSKRVVIWDWKFGAGVPVSPKENDQLRFYGRGALHTKEKWFDYPRDKDGKFMPDLRVDLVICQPRVGDGEPQVWPTTFQDLEDFRWRLVAAVSEATGRAPGYKRGDHCKWCEAKHVCPEKQRVGQRILAKVYDIAAGLAEAQDDESVFDMDAAVILKTAEVQFTPQDLADWLQDAADIEDYVKWVRSIALSELAAGREVTGFELDQGLGNSAWTVDEKTVDRRLATYGLSVEERRDTKAISPTQARKLLKKLGDEKNMKLVEKIIDRPKGAMKMVPTGTAKNPVTATPDKIAAVADKLNALAQKG